MGAQLAVQLLAEVNGQAAFEVRGLCIYLFYAFFRVTQ